MAQADIPQAFQANPALPPCLTPARDGPHAARPCEPGVGNTADEAIAAVLRAEREAQATIAQAQLEAQHIAETARASARALAERTERRIRRVVAAFERQRLALTDELDAQAAAMALPGELGAADSAALAQAVQALARQLTGGAP